MLIVVILSKLLFELQFEVFKFKHLLVMLLFLRGRIFEELLFSKSWDIKLCQIFILCLFVIFACDHGGHGAVHFIVEGEND